MSAQGPYAPFSKKHTEIKTREKKIDSVAQFPHGEIEEENRRINQENGRRRDFKEHPGRKRQEAGYEEVAEIVIHC